MPRLTVVDVGHGSAAVVEDKTGVVVVDAGRGTQVLDFLLARGITQIEAILLSHADTDHIGGAATLLHSQKLKAGRVFANVDNSKDTRAWKGFIAAVALARAEGRIHVDVGVHVGTSIRDKSAETQIDVIYPPPESLFGGVKSKISPSATSNSLSVAVRVQLARDRSVVLGGDVEFECLDFWRKSKMDVSATVAVFPHHGGAPGGAGQAGLFAFEFINNVRPDFVIFSIHESAYSLPRTDVIAGIVKAKPDVRLICTRLPSHIKDVALAGDAIWSWHLDPAAKSKAVRCGNVVIEPNAGGVVLSCSSN